MGIPSLGERSDAQCYVLRDLEKRYGDKIEFVYPKQFVGRIFHDYARSAYVEDFLATDCDVMWFLDSDIIPHDDILNVFNKYSEWDLAGAPYPVFMRTGEGQPSKVVMCVYKREPDGRFMHAPCPQQGEEFVDGIATGCIFVKRQVFEKLSKPYFEFKYENETRRMTVGEDLDFCRRVSDLGYKFYIDYTLLCGHLKKVDLREVNNYAIRYANDAIDAQDKYFRSIITKHKMEMQLKKRKPASGLILPSHLK